MFGCGSKVRKGNASSCFRSTVVIGPQHACLLPAARRSVETPVSGLSATTHINRKDFGLIWNSALETGGIVVGEAVAISLDVEFVKTQG